MQDKNSLKLLAIYEFYPEDLIEACQALGLSHELMMPISEVDASGGLQYSMDLGPTSKVISANASPEDRVQTTEAAFRYGAKSFEKLLHPSAVISKSSQLGCGVFVNALAALGAGSIIGCHVNINRTASVGHHSQIHPFASLAPGAVVTSFVEIGFGTLVGAGAVIVPEVKVGSNVIIGAGSVVTKNVPDNSVVYGNPARFQKRSPEWKWFSSCPICH